MALATAKLFVEEGAYVFITGRRQQKLDEAVKAIGKNVTGVQGDASNLADLDRLYDTVKQKKGRIDVLFVPTGDHVLSASPASAGVSHTDGREELGEGDQIEQAVVGTILNAGTVYAVPEHEMPDRVPVAALFRY